MNTYEWEIHSFLGEVKAKNIQEAIIKAFKDFFGDGTPPPYINEKFERFEILIQLKER